MSQKRKRESMEKLDSCYSVVQQSSAKGISAKEIADKLKMHRTTVHSYLNTLELMEKVYSQKGLWYAKEPEENSILGKEIELTIELPILDKQIAVAEAQLRVLCEALKEINADDPLKTFLEALKDARTIKIKGRNIEAIKEQLPKLIEEALQKQNKLKNKSFWRRLTK